MSRRQAVIQITGTYDDDLPINVSKWIRYCQNIKLKRNMSLQIRMNILQHIQLRIDLMRVFDDWKKSTICRVFLRLSMKRRYFRRVRLLYMFSKWTNVFGKYFSKYGFNRWRLKILNVRGEVFHAVRRKKFAIKSWSEYLRLAKLRHLRKCLKIWINFCNFRRKIAKMIVSFKH